MFFTYDHAGRLLTHSHQINSGKKELLAQHSYDALGQLQTKKVGNTVARPLQKVDYAYNVRGWLTNINQDAHNDNDLFNFTIRYNTATDVRKRLYNGNISQTSWNTLSPDTSTKTYTYSYDALNRITAASGASNTKYNLSGISYDKNGNLQRLVRQGHINSAATAFGTMDNLVYSYDSGNKLTKVVDNANDTYGFKDGAHQTTEYTYDASGNMLTDANKKITRISYNHLNLPTSIQINRREINYTYDATGIKQDKQAFEYYGDPIITQYAGNYVYKIPPGKRRVITPELQFISTAEGYVTPVNTSGSAAISSFRYVYQYKDHLGNIRLSYSDTNNDGVLQASSEIIEESNYYPFGLQHKGYNNTVIYNGNSTAQFIC